MSAMLTSRAELRTVTVGLLVWTMSWAAPLSAQVSGEPIDLKIAPVSGLPGDSVDMAVYLHTTGNEVAGIQIQVRALAPLTIAISDTGRPDCWRNTELNKDYTVYAFPNRAAGDWTYMRAIVVSLTNVDPIPDGALLFTCRVDIAPDAEPGEYQLTADRMEGSTSDGVAIEAVGSGGTVSVADPQEHSVPIGGDGGMGASASGGCAIAPAPHGPASVLLLALPPVLWGLRRKAQPSRQRMPGC
jgi:hypothetical protein